MDEPKSLDSLFQEKLFRIPDYQRGYAWGKEQLVAFWEDLVNLPPGRFHYTGQLMLKQVDGSLIRPDSKEYWLVQDHSFKLFHVVDRQQRLTTFTIFLQAYVELLRSLPDNKAKTDADIYVTDTLKVWDVREKFLFLPKPPDNQFRTYKFGYTVDNPSYEWMRYRILGESGAGNIRETFYTFNLSNAKRFFTEQLAMWHDREGMKGLQELYRTLTKRFLFTEHTIKDEFDVFVAFETMNNRGKDLSKLELLKNRLIYLTELYLDEELDRSERKDLRDLINSSWKEVYSQLGRNRTKPLNDDDFLRAHWMMYFKYSRQSGRDYIDFLLKEKFTPQSIHKKDIKEVELEEAEEQDAEPIIEIVDDTDSDADPESEAEKDGVPPTREVGLLHPNEIRDYVKSLKESSVYWFRTFCTDSADDVAPEEMEWLQRLNRLGMSYFRPLVMVILKSNESSKQRIRALKEIERFLFVLFRLTKTRSNYRSSEFNNAVRAVDKGTMTLEELITRLRERTDENSTTEDGDFYWNEFYELLKKKFDHGQGYYGWSGLRYFLYEYELSILEQTRQKKVEWSDLLKSGRDKISIEHVYPQTETDEWKPAFKGIRKQMRQRYCYSLGNLLLLSSAINSSLQNDSFEKKKKPTFDEDGKKLRNGYSDGSHSEIEVSQQNRWGPNEIYERGIQLLKFLEKRWELRFEHDEFREGLLFIEAVEEE